MANGDNLDCRFRMKVDLYCPAKDVHRTCRTSEITMEGLFIVGIPCLRMGAEVEVTFGDRDQGALTMPCVVDLVTLDGARLKYRNPNPYSLLELREILWPQWDRSDLLQGVLILSHWANTNSLSDWMRLTSIAADFDRNLARAQAEFRRNALGADTLPDPVGEKRVGPFAPVSNWPHAQSAA